VAYSLFSLQERGRMFVSHGEAVYEGMIIGIHSRENDLVVNPIKTKKLTNIRAAGKDDALILTPPIELTLEYAVEFIADDELVEVTPKSIRIRKRLLQEHERKRASRVEEACWPDFRPRRHLRGGVCRGNRLSADVIHSPETRCRDPAS
jgi:GTP-binding protein